MKILFIFFMFFSFLSCQDSGGGDSLSGSSDGKSKTKEAGRGFDISIDSHDDEIIYVYDSVYFDPVFGKFKGLEPAGTIRVKWEIFIDGISKTSGTGGVSSGKWVAGEYQASWAILNIKLLNKKYNKVKITVTDSLGSSVETSMTIFCDIKIPTIDVSVPSTNPVWVKNSKFELSGTLETEVNIDSFLIENSTNGQKKQMSVSENWSGVIELDSGLNDIVVKGIDIVGGIGTYETVIGSDLIAPNLLFTAPSTSNEFVTASLASASIFGTASDDLSGLATIKWENESTGDTGVASGLESWSISNINVLDGVNPIKVTGIDNVGVEKIEYFNYVVDRTPPEFITSSFNINGNLKVTFTRDIELNFSISDSFSKVTKFCIRYNLTDTPLAGDTCWNDIAIPAKNINIVKFPFELGDVSMIYKVYVWAMDEVGNISALENLGKGIKGKDYVEVQYQNIGVSPEVSNFLSVNSDSPNLPPKTSDTQASSGSDLYVKWKIEDDKTIPSGSITLDYTLDDKVYFNIISGISNSVGSGCSIDANYTGCYKWTGGIPSDNYLKLRITVSDSDGNVT